MGHVRAYLALGRYEVVALADLHEEAMNKRLFFVFAPYLNHPQQN